MFLNDIINKCLKKFTIFTLFFFLLFALQIDELKSEEIVKIPAGTFISVRTDSFISSKNVRVGDTISNFSVISDVMIDKKVVIKAGARALGIVNASKSRKIFGIPGNLEIQLQSVAAVDGTIVPVFGRVAVEGDDKILLSVLLGALVCCFCFLIPGGKADINPGTLITCSVTSTTEVSIDY